MRREVEEALVRLFSKVDADLAPKLYDRYGERAKANLRKKLGPNAGPLAADDIACEIVLLAFPSEEQTQQCPYLDCTFIGTEDEVDGHRASGVHDNEPQAGGNLRR